RETIFSLKKDFRISKEIFIKAYRQRKIRCSFGGYAIVVCNKKARIDSISENKFKSTQHLRIFPNPVKKGGILSIETAGSQQEKIFRLYNSEGRLLRTGPLDSLKDFNQIPLDSRWSSGVYWVL